MTRGHRRDMIRFERRSMPDAESRAKDRMP